MTLSTSAMLVHLDILSLTASSDPALASGLTPPATESSSTAVLVAGVKLSATPAARLRASSVDACSHIVSRAHTLAKEDESRKWLSTMRETDLDGYLWSIAKEEKLRDVHRFVERGTVFY
ncbi:hypothetical protein P7C70_g9333, partial [Phenoliferia sp. Uapishka_3]